MEKRFETADAGDERSLSKPIAMDAVVKTVARNLHRCALVSNSCTIQEKGRTTWKEDADSL